MKQPLIIENLYESSNFSTATGTSILTFWEMKTITVLFAFIGLTVGQWDPNFVPGRNVIVHLFEWRWDDIAEECERFLGPRGYGGVQISPPSENVLQLWPFRPWSERYTPISYKIFITRSGNEQEFASMIRRCNNVGVRIYVDAVINHLSGSTQSATKGTGGSDFNATAKQFPDFSAQDFNDDRCPSESGNVEDWDDPIQYRNCRLDTLLDLNQETDYVREQLVNYLNKLISYGVAGFRVDAAKHMWPESLKVIYRSLNNLPTEHGFAEGSRAFIYQEMTDLGEPNKVIGQEYYGLGRVTEFRASQFLGSMFRGNSPLKNLVNWGVGWGLYDDINALVFIDNHDNQRVYGSAGPVILSFREARQYKMATAFLLAHPYGVARIMSSYFWEQRWEGDKDENNWFGPPHTEEGDTLPVIINPDLTCGNGWICEHRWRQINHMVEFRNVVAGTPVNDWWDNGNNQIAFCRGDNGFIAINNDNHSLNERLQTCLPPGQYCDVISGGKVNNGCTGTTVTVDSDGRADIFISNEAEDPVVAIHAWSKL